jgi:hypothetical protein
VKHKLQFLFLSLCLVFTAFSQQTYQFGALPNFNLHHQLSSAWSIDYKLEHRQGFSRGVIKDDNKLNYISIFTDNSIYLFHKLDQNIKLGGGYMARFHEGKLIHRSLQVLNLNQKLAFGKLNHQFIMDQTFFQDQVPFYRWRYRIGLVLPLKNASKFYFKISNEYSYWIRMEQSEMEIRLIPMLGHQINANNKLEWGIDYRAFGFIQGYTDHRFWLAVNWHVLIP